MHTTSVSLLERLRQPSDGEAWRRFVQLYTPFIFYWGRRQGLATQDAEDLVQDVMALLLKKLPEFRYDPKMKFRSWLRTVTINKLRDIRKRRALPQVGISESAFADVPSPQDDGDFEETEYRQHLVRRAMQLMQSDFKPTTWRACWEHIVSGRSAADVAAELGITVGAVYAAKVRVLARLRQALEGLLE